MYLYHQGKHTKQAHVAVPEGTFEEEHGRQGFFGPVSHLYHTHPPTNWSKIEGPLRPRAFDFAKAAASEAVYADDSRVLLLHNQDVAVHVSRRNDTSRFYFRNGDADEIYFVHEGEGTFETEYGILTYETTFYTTPGISDEAIHFFIARELTPCPQRLEEGEHIMVESYSVDECMEKMKTGEIADGKTILGILWYIQKYQHL